jgi:hypothetical protein
MKDKPSYYAVITAEVRYNPKLSASEKLFYAEITALTQMNGKCYASNAYFAELYGVDRSTVSSWVRKLAQGGHIDVEYEYNGKEISKRFISILKPEGIHAISAPKGDDLNNHVVRKSDGGGDLINRGWLENPIDNTTLTESNTTPTESNKGAGIFLRIESAKDYKELIPIWNEYRKTKGHHTNLYEIDVLQNAWAKKRLTTLKQEMLKAIENGWKSLVELKTTEANESANKSYYKELT